MPAKDTSVYLEGHQVNKGLDLFGSVLEGRVRSSGLEGIDRLGPQSPSGVEQASG